jgi:ABC-2 type transport system permease protein
MGLMLAGVTLMIAHHVWFIGDAVAGALYLFSGAIFPLEVLPTWLRPIGFAMPLTYWLELLRRAMVGQVAESFPTLIQLSDGQLFAILIGLTVVFGIAAIIVFRWGEHQARERGLIDMVTNY